MIDLNHSPFLGLSPVLNVRILSKLRIVIGIHKVDLT